MDYMDKKSEQKNDFTIHVATTLTTKDKALYHPDFTELQNCYAVIDASRENKPVRHMVPTTANSLFLKEVGAEVAEMVMPVVREWKKSTPERTNNEFEWIKKMHMQGTDTQTYIIKVFSKTLEQFHVKVEVEDWPRDVDMPEFENDFQKEVYKNNK
eukprot:Platyproteum_vivax@DN4527_c0_g1_i1.p1